MKIQYALGIILGLVLGLWIIFYITRDNDQTILQKPITIDEYKSEFMGSCVDEGLYDYCNCTYDYMIKKEGVAGIMETSIKFQETKKLTPLMVEAVASCMKYVKN